MDRFPVQVTLTVGDFASDKRDDFVAHCVVSSIKIGEFGISAPNVDTVLRDVATAISDLLQQRIQDQSNERADA